MKKLNINTLEISDTDEDKSFLFYVDKEGKEINLSSEVYNRHYYATALADVVNNFTNKTSAMYVKRVLVLGLLLQEAGQGAVSPYIISISVASLKAHGNLTLYSPSFSCSYNLRIAAQKKKVSLVELKIDNNYFKDLGEARKNLENVEKNVVTVEEGLRSVNRKIPVLMDKVNAHYKS